MHANLIARYHGAKLSTLTQRDGLYIVLQTADKIKFPALVLSELLEAYEIKQLDIPGKKIIPSEKYVVKALR